MNRVKLPKRFFAKYTTNYIFEILQKIQLPNESQCYPLILYVTKAQHYHMCNPILNWQILLEYLLIATISY